MIGEDVIREARRAVSALEEDYGECPASQLLEQMASACEAENARRALLAAALPAGEAVTDLLIAGLRGLYPERMYGLPEMRLLLRRIDRLEALLSDAEDTLRARAEGRRAGLLEAAALCQDRMNGQSATFLGGFLAGMRDTLRDLALPAAGQSGQEG